MDGVQWRDAFETIDPKLTMFALAHGMDLSKGADYRRLEWSSNGLVRGILVRPADEGAFAVDVVAWPDGTPDKVNGRSAEDATPAEEISGALMDAIDLANALEASA